jgi:hypothetical protein
MDQSLNKMEQSVFNIAVGIAGAFGGFILKAIWDKTDKLERTDANLVKSVNELAIVVATLKAHYEDDSKKLDIIFEKLDKIDAKLDKKADK